MMPSRTTVDHGISIEERTKFSIEETEQALDQMLRAQDHLHIGDINEAVAYRRATAEETLHEEGYNPGGPRNNWIPNPKGRQLTKGEKRERECARRCSIALSQLIPSARFIPSDVPRRVLAATDVIRHGFDLLEHRAQDLEEAALLDALLLGQAWRDMLVIGVEPKIKAAKEAVAAASDRARKKAVKRHGGEAGHHDREKRKTMFEKMNAVLRENHPELSARQRAELIAKAAAKNQKWTGKNGARLAVDTVLEILRGRR
jgi:hypothetical protein